MLTLFDAPRCPYCARVRIVLAEKGVPYETVTVDLENRPARLLEHNPPHGRVPVLEEDGWVLAESAVIDEYLEERYPGSAAASGRPGRARGGPPRRCSGSTTWASRTTRSGGTSAARTQLLADALAHLDGVLAATPFLTGRAFGLADIAYLPWLLRLRDLMGVSLDPHASLARWVDACTERPSVAAEIETVASLAA